MGDKGVADRRAQGDHREGGNCGPHLRPQRLQLCLGEARRGLGPLGMEQRQGSPPEPHSPQLCSEALTQ